MSKIPLHTPVAIALVGSTLLATGCHTDPVRRLPPQNLSCATRAFNAVDVQARARPAIVRITDGKSTGTGFVIASGSGGAAIVTNYHVIAEGDKFKAVIPTAGGADAEVGVEVVKIDTKNDLAILRAPAIGALERGLSLSSDGVVLGQRVAAMGYPYVAGSTDFTLTFEPGDVSAVKRTIKDREFVQTNANINPGNSGGPVLDACGSVVGVVVATGTKQERIGLVIPVKKLIDLHNAYQASPPPAASAVKGQLAKLERAVQYRKGKEAAALFSRGFLRRTVMPVFLKRIEGAQQKEKIYAALFAAKGVDYYGASLEARMTFLQRELPRSEFQAWLIYQLLRTKQVGVYEGMTMYMSLWITEVFGEVQGLAVESVEGEGDGASANVKLQTKTGGRFYIFDMKREWGDWRIDSVRCVRGCS